MKFFNLFLFFLLTFFLSNVSAAHFIVGVVNDSLDGTSANGIEITLWNPNIGLNENISDIIGQNGNSFSDNFYMFDCELLPTPCNLGDILSIRVFFNDAGYYTKIINVSVSDAGFDFAEQLVLNSPPVINYIYVDDDISNPFGEIDLVAGGDRDISCIAEFYDYENDSINFDNSALFDNSLSNYFAIDDNNDHYSNSSCNTYFNSTTNLTLIDCSYDLKYYSNSGNWNCTIAANYSDQVNRYYSNSSFVNRLLSFSIPNEINYGNLSADSISDEIIFNVSNYGNSLLNLTLYGYGANPGDNLSMNCSIGQNISIYYQKYNLTESNPGDLNLNQFESFYKNLTSSSVTNKFSLNYRQDDIFDDAYNSTYWRIYVPVGVAGTCSGNVVFGATQASEI